MKRRTLRGHANAAKRQGKPGVSKYASKGGSYQYPFPTGKNATAARERRAAKGEIEETMASTAP